MAGSWALHRWPWPGGGPISGISNWRLFGFHVTLRHGKGIPLLTLLKTERQSVNWGGWWAVAHFFLNPGGFDPGFCRNDRLRAFMTRHHEDGSRRKCCGI